MTQQVSAKNTKAQILKAYEQLYQEHEQLRAEYDRAVRAQEEMSARVAASSTARERAARPAPKIEPGPATVDTIVDGLAALSASFGSAVSALSAELTAEVAKLHQTRAEVQDRTDHLQALYGLTVTETTLDDLIAEYQDKAHAFEQQASQVRDAFEREMAGQQAAWQEEREEHARSKRERDEILKKDRQRQAQAFKYEQAMRRQLDQEQYDNDKRARDAQWLAAVQAKEREWQARERELAEREKEWEEITARIGAFQKELAAAIKDADKEGADLARKQAKVRDELLTKEDESNRRIGELQIRSMQATIDAQAQQLTSLSAQLDAVTKRSQSLATKAIEGASRETSFQSIREIALEQAKRPPQGP